MILVKPSVEVIAITEHPLQLIEKAGRTCYKSEEKITDDSAEGFVKKVIERGHLSVIEHASMTVKFICDRGVTHEIVRHRLASYSQESTRYCDYAGGHVAFVLPPWVVIQPGKYTRADQIANKEWYRNLRIADSNWFSAMIDAEICYKTLRHAGWHPQQTRSVLPNSLKTEIVCTANFREWMHIFKLRCSPLAHPQMQEIMFKLQKAMAELYPAIFDIEWGDNL